MADAQYPNIRLLNGPGQLPVRYQIKNNLKHNISGGYLPPNSRLPSVRELAEYLRVAPNTVARVYRELQEEGLIETRQWQGTFVSDLIHARNGQAAAESSGTAPGSLLASSVTAALAAGFSPEQIRASVDQILQRKGLIVGLVGINRPIIDKWQVLLESEFSELGVRVAGLALSDLEADPTLVEREMPAVHFIFTFISAYGRVRSLLKGTGKEVLAIVLEVSMRTHEALADLPHEGTVALVCEDMYLNTFSGVVASYCDIGRIQHVTPHDEAGIRQRMEQTPYILHSRMARDPVRALAQPHHHLIEFELVPNRDCFEHYRKVLSRAQAHLGPQAPAVDVS